MRTTLQIWEIAKGMAEGEFKEGQVFQNGDLGDLIIHEDELCYLDCLESISIFIGDNNRWEILSSTMDWELKITEKFGN